MSKVKVTGIMLEFPDGSKKSLNLEEALALLGQLKDIFKDPSNKVDTKTWFRWIYGSGGPDTRTLVKRGPVMAWCYAKRKPNHD